MTAGLDDGAAGLGARLDRFLGAHRPELIAFRRHLHAYPDRSYEERETTDLVAQRLSVAGLDPRPLPGGCGLVCDIGTEGPMVAIRADLDALAMDDEKDVPYRSQRPGIAHACGHDVHTTIVLGAGLALAELLAADGGEPPSAHGRVRLIFEPAEETLPGGAADVVASGALEGVRAIYGLHCDPKLDVGQMGVRRGPLTAATDLIELDLDGPGGHTARPQLTVDLVAVAGRVAAELPGLAGARAAELGQLLLVFGALHAGDAPNVIPAHAHLRGTVRTPDRQVWRDAESIVSAAIADAVDGTGARWRLRYQKGVPPVVNDAVETDRLAAASRTLLGPDAVVEAPRSLGGDSFAWYLEHVPGTYARLGVHDPARGNERLDLHSSTFDVDERAIDVGVRVLVATALDALQAKTGDLS